MVKKEALRDYKRLGYSDNWINQRLKSIEVRKSLTDEWQRGGINGTQYASLTDIITKEWSGHTNSNILLRKTYTTYFGIKIVPPYGFGSFSCITHQSFPGGSHPL